MRYYIDKCEAYVLIDYFSSIYIWCCWQESSNSLSNYELNEIHLSQEREKKRERERETDRQRIVCHTFELRLATCSYSLVITTKTLQQQAGFGPGR